MARKAELNDSPFAFAPSNTDASPAALLLAFPKKDDPHRAADLGHIRVVHKKKNQRRAGPRLTP